MTGSVLLENQAHAPKALTGEYELPTGRHRVEVAYTIQANPAQLLNFLRISLVDLAARRTLSSVILPRKRQPDGEHKMARLHFTLGAPSRLALAIAIDGPGRVAIHRIDFKPIGDEGMPADPFALFINPDRGLTSERIVHQGISSIGAYLQARGVASHALITSTSSDEFIFDVVNRYDYKYVGFYTTSDDSVLGAVKSLITGIKARRPDIIAVAGGVHATLDPEDLMTRIPEVDLCVRGEGEETCFDLAAGKDWSAIAGLTYRAEGRLVHNAPRPVLPLNQLCAPLRDNYFNPDWSANSLSTSRGCPHQCHFCIGHRIFGRNIRFRPLEDIDRELQSLYETGDHSLILSINDDMFNMKRDRTLALMELFKKYPFCYFPRGMRADRLDADTARAMREAGVVGTSIGIECADDEALKAMRKGETLAQIVQGIRHLQANGIDIVGQFMIGNIGDTLESVKRTIDFIHEHDIRDLNISCAIPFPGTALRQYVSENKLMLAKPHQVYQDVTNGNTTIFFETPRFPLADRIKAVELVNAAGLYTRARC